MRVAYSVLALVALSACTSAPPENARSSDTNTVPKAIVAFRDICLSTAPSFSGAVEAAQKHGIGKITDAGFMKMGFNADRSIGVQIQNDKECTITTPSQRSKNLTGQFLSSVGEYSGTAVSQTVPSKVTIRGQSFIIMHDRDGGEAFVILKN
jgi:hypothetical protein